MSQQITKRCHWVPQSYLKTFAADIKGQKIWRFSKTSGAPELKRIDKVAVKFHLYAPMNTDGTRNDVLEKKLSELENWFGHPIWEEICSGFPDFTSMPLRQMVALLVAVMWLRTPKQFDAWKDMHRTIVNHFGGKDTLPEAIIIKDQRITLDHSSWPAFQNATEEDMKRNWNEHLSEAGEISKLFLEMRWAILFSDSPVFITSDNPVLLGDTTSRFQGLKHPDAWVTFPLSPTRVLMMDNRHDEPDAQFYALNHDPAATNLLVWRNAIEHMFSHRNPDEVCAEINAHASSMGY